MLATLTGLGLSASAGLNAYIPLLTVGLMARYTDAVPLGQAWQWIEHPATLAVLGVLLAVELIADKVPALDHLNDTLQTFVRPTSGGITFAAGSTAVPLGEIAGEASAGAEGSGGPAWGALLAGCLVALALHAVKTLARPMANTATLGCAAPVLSAVEDAVSFATSLLAVVVPLLVLVILPLVVLGGFLLLRRRRARAPRPTGVPAPEDPEVPGPWLPGAGPRGERGD
ncbi:hypothetical protein GCM10007147_25820 [Nocardiopsis kunsanensis]|uniref:DUF4126 domain-containing protein n=1 Tax=Nocardiopsis kunsanensis TaxID=141693 RepID=A0A919CI63_9ACTN|nr:DUF4126 domain-containing protein [Nocardiopsis kunsanensis]GHD27079.1 hypothetical protein GCM10007147_25820 [Nocardiopsis kunsanensis]